MVVMRVNGTVQNWRANYHPHHLRGGGVGIGHPFAAKNAVHECIGHGALRGLGPAPREVLNRDHTPRNQNPT